MLHFENPWLLLLLPLPWFLWKGLPPVALTENFALRVPFFNRVKKTVVDSSSSYFNSQRLIIGFCIWGLLILSAADPEWVGKLTNMVRSGRDIILAVDLSGSMEIPDMSLNGNPVDRLTLVKNIARDFIDRRTGDRLGLILFGTRAYLQTPLTFDRTTVEQTLDDATISLAGPQTAIGDAMGLAIKHLLQYPDDEKVIVLLTDGMNNAGHVSPLDAAKIAAEAGIRVYTVGLGATQLMLPDFFGSAQVVNPSHDLDEETLRTIAQLTKGVYFRAKNSEDLQQVYEQLDQLEPNIVDQQSYHTIIELYPWTLGLAFLLSMIVTLQILNRGSYAKS